MIKEKKEQHAIWELFFTDQIETNLSTDMKSSVTYNSANLNDFRLDTGGEILSKSGTGAYLL